MDIISTIAEMINSKYEEDPNANILVTSPFINCGMDFDVVGNIRKSLMQIHERFSRGLSLDYYDPFSNICVIGGFLNTNYLTKRCAADFFRHLFISLKDEGLMSYFVVLPDDKAAPTIIEHDINFILQETCFSYFDSTKKQMNGWGIYKIDFRKMTREEIYGGDYHKHPWWDGNDRAEMLFEVVKSFCDPDSIFDLGGGAGNFVDCCRSHGIWSASFNEDLVNDIVIGHNPWSKCRTRIYDMTCFQVLEHIHPALIEQTLDNIKSIPHKIFITTVSLDYAREHFCVRERSWWENKFIEHGWNSVPLEEIVSKTKHIFDKYRSIANKTTVYGVDEEEKGLFVLIPKE